MWLQVFVLVVWTLDYLLIISMLYEMLTPRHSKKHIFRWLFPISMGVSLLKLALLNWASADIAITINAITSTVPLIVFAKLTCDDRLWKIILSVVIILVVGTLGDIPATAISSWLYGGPVNFDLDDPRIIVLMIIGHAVFLIGCVFLMTIWKWNMQHIQIRIADVLVFILLPISQVLFFLEKTERIADAMHYGPLSIVGIAMSLWAYVIVFRMILTQSEKRAVEKQLRDMEYAWAIEKQQMAALETRQYEILKIQHDFNNQIMVVRRLMAQNRTNSAHGILGSL